MFTLSVVLLYSNHPFCKHKGYTNIEHIWKQSMCHIDNVSISIDLRSSKFNLILTKLTKPVKHLEEDFGPTGKVEAVMPLLTFTQTSTLQFHSVHLFVPALPPTPLTGRFLGGNLQKLISYVLTREMIS